MDVYEEIKGLCVNAGAAASRLALMDTESKNRALCAVADAIEQDSDKILEANALDVRLAAENGVPSTMIDRLKLTEARVAGMCRAIRAVTLLEDPVGMTQSWSRPSGIKISRVRVPLGVVAIIYEARPNVTADSAALCLKTGNAVVLRGGKEAINTNIAIVNSIKRALIGSNVDPHSVELVTNTDRESATALMSARGYVDVLIPRGGKGLIQSVIENAKVPVIETGAGNCHLFVDDSADVDMAVNIALNAKCSRPSVCNAIETVLVHAGIAAKFLPEFAKAMQEYNVQIRGCAKTCVLLPTAFRATDEDYYTEFNDYIVAVRVVDTLNDAIAHINKYSTSHSEAIVTSDDEHALRFQREVNSAAVYVNASTRFTDGGEFGFGAEIGISTQKLHVRGPMGLLALTTEKYLINGNGEVRK